jgi:hypothetical protein
MSTNEQLDAVDIVHVEQREDTRRSALPKDDSSPDLPLTKQEENTEKKCKKGRIAGGSLLKELHESDSDNPEERPLREVDIGFPLTFTEFVTQDDQEYIILKFADDDKEDPFNWSRGRKAWITFLLCLMTLFIGLATTAYSSGIDRMCDDFGVST